MQVVHFTVNGKPVDIAVAEEEYLVDTLRNRLHLTGTKKGCDQGTCGSCTVHVDGIPVLSCLTLTLRCEGRAITTIEGIGYHPVQKQLVEKGGLQCGYCTPGFVMTAVAYLQENPHPTREEWKEALSGNLCRCTGYKKILDALEAAGEGESA